MEVREKKLFSPKNLPISSYIQHKNLKFEGRTVEVHLPCCIAPLSKDSLIFCDYNNLFWLDLKQAKIKLLEPPPSLSVWRPTGLKYVKEQNRLYVANYKGRDVIVFHLNANNDIELIHRYADEHFLEPENVDLSSDGKMMLVGDFAAGQVFIYENGNLHHSFPILGAHGIAFTKDCDAILASGLGFGKIVKLSLKGKLEKEWLNEPWTGDGFLWPTSIAVSSKNIAISDAHTGKITFMDSDLNCKYSIAGNGLGHDLLNMPYGIAYGEEGDLLIADTFKKRILKINSETDELLSIYNLSREKANDSLFRLIRNKKQICNKPPQGDKYKTRTNLGEKFSFDLYPLFYYTWHPAYNGFAREGMQLSLAGIAELAGGMYEYYWMLAQEFYYKTQKFLIFGSPQSPFWLVLYDSMIFILENGLDFWFDNGCLISSQGNKINCSEIAKRVLKLFRQYRSKITAGQSFVKALEALYGEKNFQARFKAAFKSEQGQRFYHALCNRENLENLKEVAMQYRQEIQDHTHLYLFEIALANKILQNIEYA